LEFGIWNFRVETFRVWSLGFRVQSLEFKI